MWKFLFLCGVKEHYKTDVFRHIRCLKALKEAYDPSQICIYVQDEVSCAG